LVISVVREQGAEPMISTTRHRPKPGTRRALVLVAAAITLAGGALGVSAAPGAAARDADTAKGTGLVERFFDQLEDGNAAGLEQFLSSAFQLQGADGGFLTKEEFLANPPKLDSYELSGLRVTRTGKVIVARYDVAAVLTINGVQQSRDPAPRLSVFVATKKGWQLVAHANFNVAATQPQE
jgi:hypothetical protein